MTDLLAKVKSTVAGVSNSDVAEKVGCTPQAVGKALATHDNPFKYFSLRVKILEAYGISVEGPFFNFTTNLFRKP